MLRLFIKLMFEELTAGIRKMLFLSFTPREFQLPIVVYNWMTKKLTRKITIYQSQQKSQNCDVEPQTAIL